MSGFDGYSNPFNSSHPDPQLVRMFRGIRQDARSEPKPTVLARMADIAITFDGGGQALVVGMGGFLEVPFGCRIMGARLLADVSCSATVDLRYGTFTDFPTGAIPYDTIPALSAAQKVDLSVAGWHQRLVARDILQYQLTTFTGTATKLSLVLWVRKTDGPSGASGVVDSSNNSVIDSSGNTVSLRS